MSKEIMLCFVLALFTILFIGFVVCGVFFVIERIIKTESKPIYNLSFDELLVILGLIINSELDEYDNELLVGDRPITNQNFDAFYKDITDKIISNLSPDLLNALQLYTTEDNIIRIVARRTKTYLRGKIQ